MSQYVSAEQLAERYGVDKSTIWRWTQRDILPKPVRLSEQCTRWKLDQIEQRDAEREQAAA
jgi:predicted DNA-binding transcriptional regulator AlpA